MGTREILLILVSCILGLGCIYYIRLLDRYEREPFGKLVLTTLLGGGGAWVIALALFEVIDRFGFHNFQSYVGALLVIGPVEELAKLIGLIAVFGIIRNELNEPADGIIYMACVALGFSLIENFIYAAHPSNEHLVVIRLLVATPLHIGFSALMGLCVYIWLGNRNAFHLIVTAYLLASLNHGLYDLIVFNHYSILLLGVTILLMYGFTRDLFIYALTVSPHRITLAQAIGANGDVHTADGPVCLHCGTTGAKASYTIGRISLQQCVRCDYFTVTLKDLFHLFYHFAGLLKQNAKKRVAVTEGDTCLMTLCRGIRICPKRKLASFRLKEMDAVLEKLNYALKIRMKSKWYLPKNLFRLDHPGVAIDYPKMVRDGKGVLWRRLIFPFSPTRRQIHRPPGGGPLWHWSAFFIPEVWYAAHGLWGVMIGIVGIYLVAAYSAMAVGLSLPIALGVTALVMRTASGFGGCRIYYRRHGKWPRSRF